MSAESFAKPPAKMLFLKEQYPFPPIFETEAELPPPGSLSLADCNPESALLPPLPIVEKQLPKKIRDYPPLKPLHKEYIKRNFQQDGHYQSNIVPYEIIVQNQCTFIIFPPGYYTLRLGDYRGGDLNQVSVQYDGFLLKYGLWKDGGGGVTGRISAHQLGASFPYPPTITKLEPFLPEILKHARAQGHDTLGKMHTSHLGAGVYGQVQYGMNIDTEEIVAIKRVTLDDPEDANKHELQEPFVLRKLQRLAAFPKTEYKLNSRDKFYVNDCTSKHAILFVMDLAKGMDLETYLQRNEKIPLEKMTIIISGIIDELALLRREGIVHCDIKFKNIIIDPDTFTIKLVDFGLSLFDVDRSSDFYLDDEETLESSDRYRSGTREIQDLGRVISSLEPYVIKDHCTKKCSRALFAFFENLRDTEEPSLDLEPIRTMVNQTKDLIKQRISVSPSAASDVGFFAGSLRRPKDKSRRQEATTPVESSTVKRPKQFE